MKPILFLVLLLSLGIQSSFAQGDLLITPRRIVFDNQKRVQEINLANTGRDTARYIISMLEIRMRKDGGFEQITVPDSGQNFASNLVRYFPHSVVLGPGEAQAVKMQISRQDQLPVGEYRSHLYFRAVPDENPLGENIKLKDSLNISVSLTPVFGISIPVIIRVGALSSVVALDSAIFKMLPDNGPVLSVRILRSGSASTYGDLKIEWIPLIGKTIMVANVKGLAVYTPTTSRTIKIPLDKNADLKYRSGRLHISYLMPADAKSGLIAETELQLH